MQAVKFDGQAITRYAIQELFNLLAGF